MFFDSVLCLGDGATFDASHVFTTRWMDHFVTSGVLDTDPKMVTLQYLRQVRPRALFDSHCTSFKA